MPLTTPRGTPVLPAAVLWDMDGTLVDSEKLWDVSLADLVHRLGGELSARTRAAMVGGALEQTVRLAFAEVGRVPDADGAREAERYLTERTGELFAAGLPWRPGAPEALRAVRASAVPTALVTSTRRGLTDLALRSIGADLFDVSVCGDEVTRPKPAPDPYRRAAELLGVDPARCVAVEDSPTGTASAVAAGCTVLVVPSEVPVEPGERRVLRESLAGVDAAVLGGLLTGR